MKKTVSVVFKGEYSNLRVSATHADGVTLAKEEGKVNVTLDNPAVNMGAGATVVTLRFDGAGFSFFLRDVDRRYPICVPEYGAAVTEEDDSRSYQEIVADILVCGGKSALRRIESSSETSFESAAEKNRNLKAATWLGLSRDIRFFEVGVRDYKTDQWDTLSRNVEQWDSVSPRYFGHYVENEELPTKQVKYVFMTGRGAGCDSDVKRELEDGYLPILHQTNSDNGILYKTTYFATNEFSPLNLSTLRGTEMYAADAAGMGVMFTEKQEAEVKAAKAREKEREDAESVVLHLRISMKNTERTPRYAFVHLPDLLMFRASITDGRAVPKFNSETGLGLMPSGLVYLSAKCSNGEKLQNESAILVKPGEEINIDCVIPHAPLARERGEKLLSESFDYRLAECKRFWRDKLNAYCKVYVPEKRINDMLKAGLLHVETVTFGREPDGAVVPAVGKYTAIGSESSPQIQLLDSFGNASLAERSIEYFIKKQHEDGFIQNYWGYMLETGFALWTMGEHYRYTRDEAWAERIADNVIAACEYNIRWAQDNLGEELTGRGYGMIAGRTDDPEGDYHSYMLNSGAYAGFAAAADILRHCRPDEAEKYKKEAEKCRKNVLASLKEGLIHAPVVPLTDGSWVPSFSPYTESIGPAALYCEEGDVYSHSTFLVREMSGADYLPLHGVLDTDDGICRFMEEFWADFLCRKNVGFSQPYYSPHPYINLMRGNVKAFLSEFYNGMSALADRETYTFLEHFFEASVHKTHEEAWFLMRLRWMLWLEDKNVLRILAGVPRAWLRDSERISADGVKTKFGALTFEVTSELSRGIIRASVHVDWHKGARPERLSVRLPHPEERKALRVEGGSYDKKTETVSFVCDRSDFTATLYFS